ncbi:MAG: hypothetical protein IJZ23_07855 [Roseburia sp.]|nr:hypothetical protein [Roseburia sp.]
MVVRPKRYFMIQFCGWKCVLHLYPQQRWECEIGHKNSIPYEREYRLSRDNVTLNFSEKEFKEYFKVVEK